MLMCELLAILLVKFDTFARSFADKKSDVHNQPLMQVWDVLPWIKDPELNNKPMDSLRPWLG